jgi:NAD-dependent dihydropyrimidine dehydrogenase PreA subunit
MGPLSWLTRSPGKGIGGNATELSAGQVERRRLPVIDTDRCLGCESCVNVCEHGCLEMIWSFATLTQARTCCGEGRCVEACPARIIQMALVPVEADATDPRRFPTGGQPASHACGVGYLACPP